MTQTLTLSVEMTQTLTLSMEMTQTLTLSVEMTQTLTLSEEMMTRFTLAIGGSGRETREAHIAAKGGKDQPLELIRTARM
jgi:hypothetical protein